MSKVIKEAAARVFADYPEADKVYVTEDGQAFLEHARNLAENHARSAGLPAPLVVLRVALDAADDARKEAEGKARKLAEDEAAAKETIAAGTEGANQSGASTQAAPSPGANGKNGKKGK